MAALGRLRRARALALALARTVRRLSGSPPLHAVAAPAPAGPPGRMPVGP
ncbi:hypothetical protein [Kitasatospora cinereorecta]|uniref:Uncharacterized protein n=1 Tax=Kitasatospora cinereorecta TaxID=285560 RepID=A0ABW0VN55_9ACTN